MIHLSRQFILCVFFLQYSLIALGGNATVLVKSSERSSQSLGKTKQSHSYLSLKVKTSKTNPANSFTDVKRSENCIGLCKEEHIVKASWYGPGFHGKETRCGQIYNQNALTAASNTLPCGAKVRLRYHKTGKSVIVRITDTGGFKKYGRDIDISRGAAKKIGMVSDGVAQLSVSVIYMPKPDA